VHHDDVSTEPEASDGPALTPPSRRFPPAERYTAAVSARTGARGRFVIVAAVALILLALTWSVAVGTELGQRIENAALLGAEFRTSAERERGLERLSVIGTTMFGIAVVVIFIAAVARRRAALGGVVAAAMIVSVGAAELLKAVLPRPELVTGPVWLLRNSFPSGTAAVASAVAIGALLVAPGRLRWLALAAGALYAAVIGEATQATGWHRLSDVVGSMLIVIAVASGALVVLAATGLVQPGGRGRIAHRVRNTLTVLALVSLLLGAALLVMATIFPLLASTSGVRRVFLQTAFPLFGAGFTVVALTLFARVVEPFELGTAVRTSDGDASAAR
jgi:membrane-associated phospholipid phosphatase